MTFADNLVRLRREKGFSQEQLADLMDVSRQAVSDGMLAARKKLEEYEAKLGLVRRYLAITAEAEAGLRALDGGNIDEARRCLTNIMRIER